MTPEEIRITEARVEHEGYVHRVLVGLDQATNVVLGGHPDETISARSQRAAERHQWLGEAMTWFLNKVQAQHGVKSEVGDLERSETVATIEKDSLGVK